MAEEETEEFSGTETRKIDRKAQLNEGDTIKITRNEGTGVREFSKVFPVPSGWCGSIRVIFELWKKQD